MAMAILLFAAACIVIYPIYIALCSNRYLAMGILLVQIIYALFFTVEYSIIFVLKYLVVNITTFLILGSRIFVGSSVFRRFAVVFLALNILMVLPAEFLSVGILPKVNSLIGCCLGLYVFFKMRDTDVEKTYPHTFFFDVHFPFLISYALWNMALQMKYLNDKFLFCYLLGMVPPLAHSVMKRNSKMFAMNRMIMLSLIVFIFVVLQNHEYLRKYFLYEESLYILSIGHVYTTAVCMSICAFIFFLITQYKK